LQLALMTLAVAIDVVSPILLWYGPRDYRHDNETDHADDSMVLMSLLMMTTCMSTTR
jgi:hypothetical protein